MDGAVARTGVARAPLSLGAGGVSGAGGGDWAMSSERAADGADAEGAARKSSAAPELGTSGRIAGSGGALGFWERGIRGRAS
jgi:hypothetical protein